MMREMAATDVKKQTQHLAISVRVGLHAESDDLAPVFFVCTFETPN